jgi:hypothetical protein
MIAATFVLILLVFFAFGLIAAISRDKTFLLPAGATLILLGSMLMVQPTLEVRTGDKDIVKKNVSVNKTVINETVDRWDINAHFSGQKGVMDDFTHNIAFILLIAGIFCLLIGGFTSGVRISRSLRG